MLNEVKTYHVSGMSCEHCVSSINCAVGSIEGVTAVNVDLASQTVTVGFDTDKTDIYKIRKAIEDTGYEVKY